MAQQTDDAQLAASEDQSVIRQGERPIADAPYQSPAVDIIEGEDGVTLVADIPGVARDDVDIDVKDRVLTITGHLRRDPVDGEPVYREQRVGGYTRRFSLRDGFDHSKITARLVDGVLTVELPMAASRQPRKVAIEAG